MLSVVVPVYNVEKYVEKCLIELKNQDLKDIEIIVVDDGSTDGSGKTVDKFCQDCDNFTVYHKKNGGLMSAWMYGVSKAKGDYIGFIDSDDYPDRKMFNTMYIAAKNHDADIVYCDYYVLSMSGELKRIATTDSSIVPEGFHYGAEMDYILTRIFPSLNGGCISNARWNKIFRRELFLENIQYCECMSRTFEDRYIVPACMFTAKSFLYIKTPLYYYLDRDGSNCGKPAKALFEDIQRLTGIQKKALEDKLIFDKYQTNWEQAALDIAKQFVKRNIVGYGSYSLAAESANKLIKSKEYNSLILKYATDLKKNGKLGKAMVLSAKFNQPIILVACRMLTKRRYK